MQKAIFVRMEEDLHDEAVKLAKEQGISFTALIKNLVEEWVKITRSEK